MAVRILRIHPVYTLEDLRYRYNLVVHILHRRKPRVLDKHPPTYTVGNKGGTLVYHRRDHILAAPLYRHSWVWRP